MKNIIPNWEGVYFFQQDTRSLIPIADCDQNMYDYMKTVIEDYDHEADEGRATGDWTILRINLTKHLHLLGWFLHEKRALLRKREQWEKETKKKIMQLTCRDARWRPADDDQVSDGWEHIDAGVPIDPFDYES